MRSDLEVADIFRRHGPSYAQAHAGHLGRVERRIMSAIELCRTAALGGHIEACEDCSHARVDYAVAATLKTIAADPRHLGGEIGFLAILHTWGQALTHHPHIHCLVPGGALSSDGRWLSCQPRFFLPIHVLSRLFRRGFLERLQAAHAARRLRFSGALHGLADAGAFAAAIRQLRRKTWIIYAKPPFGSPGHVLAYLGRYTHRVAIANSRLVSVDETSVTFRWRDYRHGNAHRLMSLDPHEFIRRFLIHSLPDGFHRIRHYGFLANGCRRARLAIIRQLLATEPTPTHAAGEAARPLPRFDPSVCPCCGGVLRIMATVPCWRPGHLVHRLIHREHALRSEHRS